MIFHTHYVQYNHFRLKAGDYTDLLGHRHDNSTTHPINSYSSSLYSLAITHDKNSRYDYSLSIGGTSLPIP
jgi:hypothetical protein